MSGFRLRHMLDAAREATAFMRGRTKDHLAQDRMLLLALAGPTALIPPSPQLCILNGPHVTQNHSFAYSIKTRRSRSGLY